MGAHDERDMPLAVLALPKADAKRITCARHILGCVLADPELASAPGLAELEVHIDAYGEAAERVLTRAKGTVQARRAAKVLVTQDLGHLRDFVQGVADRSGSPAEAERVITKAGMRVKKPYARTKDPLTAKNVSPSGTVRLEAKAIAACAMYYWFFSLDQLHWTRVTETMQAHAIISGLTPGQTYYFRFSARTRAGAVDPSQVVSLIVG